MINYSTCMRGNPTDKDAAKKRMPTPSTHK